MFVSIVAHVHTKVTPSDGVESHSIGRDSVVELVQGFLLSGSDTESCIASAAALAEEVIKELAKLEVVLWTMIKPFTSVSPPSSSKDPMAPSSSSSTKKRRKSVPTNNISVPQIRGTSSLPKSGGTSRVILCAPPSSLEPMIEAGVFALKWLPLDGLPSIVLVTDGVCRDKQLLTTYDGMIMQLCRRDITLNVLQLGIEEGSGSAAFGMVSDTDTIGRLCEMTGGSLFNPKLLKSLIRLPATILSASSVGSTNGGSSEDGSYGNLMSSKNSSTYSGGNFSSIGSLRNTMSASSLSMLSSWSSFPVPNLTRSMSNSREDGLRPSAFHQAMLFRLSPLSGMEGDQLNPILSFSGPEGDPSFKVILIRQAADRCESKHR